MTEEEVKFEGPKTYTDLLEIGSLSTPEQTQILRKLQLINKDKLAIKDRSMLVELSLPDFGTESCKNVFVLFRKLNELKQGGKEIKVNWYFEPNDFEARGAGEDFKEIFNLDIALIEREN